MSDWKEVRRLARQRHNELCDNQPSLVPATTLLAAAQVATGIKVIGRPAGDTLLDGAEAAYDREQALIYHSLATPADLLQFHLAHEFGHHWLDEAGAVCAHADIDVLVSSEPEMSSVGNQDSYSPKERAEAQANLFAREFLLPRDKLRARCADGIPDADAIASELGVPVDLVMQQLADAFLLPPEANNEASVRQEAPPDDSQRNAITAGDGPRQVRAGPGTGKTRTLIGRVVHLIDHGEDPSPRESVPQSGSRQLPSGPERFTPTAWSCCESTDKPWALQQSRDSWIAPIVSWCLKSCCRSSI
jgi:DNA helicase-2/ATP-dependent DNA helicase PcrA